MRALLNRKPDMDVRSSSWSCLLARFCIYKLSRGSCSSGESVYTLVRFARLGSEVRHRMRNLVITPGILRKIGQPCHGSLTQRIVEQCFENHCGRLCTDDREEHRTDPPTRWFVAPDNHNRPIKVVYVQEGVTVYLKSAYPADPDVVRVFNKYAK